MSTTSPVDACLSHARTAREQQVVDLQAQTGDTLYPGVPEEPDDFSHQHAAMSDTKPEDRLVEDKGDVKAATANKNFDEAPGATPPEQTTTHAVASEGDIHQPTAHKLLDEEAGKKAAKE